MDVLLALARPEIDRQAILVAAGDTMRVQFCDRLAELHRRVLEAAPNLVLVALSEDARDHISSVLTALHNRQPWTAVCLYVSYILTEVRTAAELACHGVISGIIFRGFDPLAPALRKMMLRARLTSDAAQVIDALSPHFPEHLRPFLASCTHEAVHPTSVREVARCAAIPLRTLEWQLQHYALPTPQRIFGWCRLLRAALRIEHPGSTLKVVAAGLGYPSPLALARHLRRQAGLTPTRLRRNGGFRYLLDRAVADLVAHAVPGGAVVSIAPVNRTRLDSTESASH
jgi:AraC-like DNA-binding protein